MISQQSRGQSPDYGRRATDTVFYLESIKTDLARKKHYILKIAYSHFTFATEKTQIYSPARMLDKDYTYIHVYNEKYMGNQMPSRS